MAVRWTLAPGLLFFTLLVLIGVSQAAVDLPALSMTPVYKRVEWLEGVNKRIKCCMSPVDGDFELQIVNVVGSADWIKARGFAFEVPEDQQRFCVEYSIPAVESVHGGKYICQMVVKNYLTTEVTVAVNTASANGTGQPKRPYFRSRDW